MDYFRQREKMKLRTMYAMMRTAMTPSTSQTLRAVTGLVKQGAEAARSKQTLEGVTDFTAEAAAAADVPARVKADPAAAAKAFVDLLASDRLIAPLLASSAASDQKEPSQ